MSLIIFSIIFHFLGAESINTDILYEIKAFCFSIISGTKKRTGLPKSTVKKSKKKDSFIISDSSSVTDDDGLILYHRDLAERIKVDVAKTTPRRSIK